MKKMWKKAMAVALSAAMVLSMAACGKKEEAPAAEAGSAAEAPAGDAAEAPAEEAEPKKIGLVCDVSGTQVFVLDMIDGFKKSAEKYGFEAIVAECADAGAYEDNARALLEEGVDLLIGGGWQSGEAIQKMATEFPDKADYAIIDTEVEAENVKCVSFREQEGAYLIGLIATMVTEPEDMVYGGVHVSQGASSFKWRWAYAEAIKSVKPDAEFIFNYVGSYNDPAKAKEYAIQQYEQGCRFVNAAAAGGDKGVFEAAKEKGFYTSGQDVDLTDPSNPWIVSSQLKDTGATMENLIDAYYGDWNTDNVTWGVAEGTIGAVHVTHDSENPISEQLSEEEIATLKETAEKIASGEIKLEVPNEEDYEF